MLHSSYHRFIALFIRCDANAASILHFLWFTHVIDRQSEGFLRIPTEAAFLFFIQSLRVWICKLMGFHYRIRHFNDDFLCYLSFSRSFRKYYDSGDRTSNKSCLVATILFRQLYECRKVKSIDHLICCVSSVKQKSNDYAEEVNRIKALKWK